MTFGPKETRMRVLLLAPPIIKTRGQLKQTLHAVSLVMRLV